MVKQLSLIGAVASAVALAGAVPAAAAAPLRAGYDVAATVTSAKASFVVPEITCSSADLRGIGIGLGIEDEAGSPTTLAVVYVTCLGVGHAYYQVHSVANGASTSDSSDVFPGDRIDVSYEAKARTLKVKTLDRTTGAASIAIGFPPGDDNITFGSFPLTLPGGGAAATPEFADVKLHDMKVNGKRVKGDGAVKLEENPDISVGSLRKGNFTLSYIEHTARVA
jgi:hypothetical protein